MLDQAWVKMSDQGLEMGGRHRADRRRRRWWVWLRWGSAEERGKGWCWGGDQTKRGIVVLFPPAVSHYSIKNPSSHWSAHCSLHHDKRTLELPPSPVPCLLSFGSSSLPVPCGLLRATASLAWPRATEASALRSDEKMSRLHSVTGGQVMLCPDRAPLPHPTTHPSSKAAQSCC